MTNYDTLEPCPRCGRIDLHTCVVPDERERPTLPASDEVRERVAEKIGFALCEHDEDTLAHGLTLDEWRGLADAAIEAIATTASARVSGGDKDRENLVARPSDEVRDDPTGGERDLEAALLKCRDQFEFYATEHRFKADKAKQEWDDACYWGNVTEQDAKKSEYQKRKKQAETNEQFAALCSAALSAIPADPVFPRLTEAMIIAACQAHYGKDATNIDGIDLTVNGRNWTFREGFKRMWSGALAAYRGK